MKTSALSLPYLSFTRSQTCRLSSSWLNCWLSPPLLNHCLHLVTTQSPLFSSSAESLSSSFVVDLVGEPGNVHSPYSSINGGSLSSVVASAMVVAWISALAQVV